MKKTLLITIFFYMLAVTSYADTSLKSLIDKSVSLIEENKPDSSIFYSNQALQISIAEQNKKMQAFSNYNLAKSYILKSEFTLAMQHILSADSIYKTLNDTAGIAQSNLQMGLLEYTQQNYLGALPYFEVAIKTAGGNDPSTSLRTNNSKLVSTCKYLEGLVYLELNQLDKAESLLNSALKAKKDAGNETGYYECTYGLAELNYKRGDYKTASTLYSECLNFFTKNENPAGVAVANIGLANIFYKENKVDSAIQHYLMAYNISRDNNYLDGKLKSTKLLADLYREIKVYDKAFEYLNEYHNQHDSIYNIENTRKLTKLQYELSLARKQLEINVLSKQRAKDKLLLLLMVVSTILLIGVTISVFRSYRFKQQSNRELEQTLKELKNMQQQLIQSEKLASLGHLTAGVSHELKNPLNFIINFSSYCSELLNEFPSSGQEHKDEIMNDLKLNLGKIQSHGERANSIITNMMMHARKSDEVKTITNLSVLVRETVDLAYQGMRATVPSFYCKVNTNIANNKIIVNVIQQEIGRTILNIMNNSFYATTQRIGSESNYKPEVKINLALKAQQAEITIEDNGIGMTEEIRSQIFEPFFTTKPTGEGTGLGLSMCYDMIHSNGGTITVESEPMVFTKFRITLPIEDFNS